jgi:hypothetical protein
MRQRKVTGPLMKLRSQSRFETIGSRWRLGRQTRRFIHDQRHASIPEHINWFENGYDSSSYRVSSPSMPCAENRLEMSGGVSRYNLRMIQSDETTASPPTADSKLSAQPDRRYQDFSGQKEGVGWRILRSLRMSLREAIGLATIVMLGIGLIATTVRLRLREAELASMRSEFGYLSDSVAGQIAAARAPSEQPLTYRARMRVPEGATAYRVAYSSHWPQHAAAPQWFGAVPVPPGESILMVQIHEDPRDRRWKISAAVTARRGTRRMATVLPPEQVTLFRGSHEVVSTGIGRDTVAVPKDQSIRLLDERWLVGEAGLLLYGDRTPEQDQIGVYAELQPDVGPL